MSVMYFLWCLFVTDEWVPHVRGLLLTAGGWSGKQGTVFNAGGFIQKTAKTTTQQFQLESLHQVYVVQKQGAVYIHCKMVV